MHTENQNLWHDFVMALNNAVIEGFSKSALEKVCSTLNKTFKNNPGSLGLIKFVLVQTKNEELIPPIYDVLNSLRIKRGKGKSHGNWMVSEGSLIDDARNTLDDVIQSIDHLVSVLSKLKI